MATAQRVKVSEQDIQEFIRNPVWTEFMAMVEVRRNLLFNVEVPQDPSMYLGQLKELEFVKKLPEILSAKVKIQDDKDKAKAQLESEED